MRVTYSQHEVWTIKLACNGMLSSSGGGAPGMKYLAYKSGPLLVPVAAACECPCIQPKGSRAAFECSLPVLLGAQMHCSQY